MAETVFAHSASPIARSREFGGGAKPEHVLGNAVSRLASTGTLDRLGFDVTDDGEALDERSFVHMSAEEAREWVQQTLTKLASALPDDLARHLLKWRDPREAALSLFSQLRASSARFSSSDDPERRVNCRASRKGSLASVSAQNAVSGNELTIHGKTGAAVALLAAGPEAPQSATVNPAEVVLTSAGGWLPKRSISRTWKYASVPEPAPSKPEPFRTPPRERARIRAEAFQATMGTEGLTRAGLAKKLGVSRAWVTKSLVHLRRQ